MISREQIGDGALLARLGLLYLAFGATFMFYGTFIVTTMLREYGFSEAKAGMYRSWAGFFSLFSGVMYRQSHRQLHGRLPAGGDYYCRSDDLCAVSAEAGPRFLTAQVGPNTFLGRP